MQAETEHLLIVPDDAAGGRLDRYLSSLFATLSRSQVQRAIRLGLVSVDGVTAAKTGIALQAGQEITFQAPPREPVKAVPQDIPLEVLYEDAHLLVVNKAAGMVVHPAPGHPDGTLVNALLGRDPALGGLGPLRPGIVHRLDRGTSGCIVVARTDRAREGLSEQFLARSLFKGYLAVTLGAPNEPTGFIDRPIERHARERKRFTSRSESGRSARTAYRFHHHSHGLGVAAVRIYTGRTHQIRVHLVDSQWPVAADDLYAPRWQRLPLLRRPELADACADGPLLHAFRLAFEHPVTGASIDVLAPLPHRFRAVLETLQEGLTDQLESAAAEPTFFGGEPT